MTDAAAGGGGGLVRAAGAPAARALAGCVLVAGGIAGLAFLPEASALWTLLPQLLAGFGIGMAFPALAGELLPRAHAQRSRPRCCRCATSASRWRSCVLAPIVAAELDDQVQLARERGTALVLDAALPPTDKIELAPRLFANLETDDPRDALAQSLARERHRITHRRPRPAQPPRSASTASWAAAASCSTGSSSSRTATGARSTRPPAGSTSCSAPTARRGCSTT